MIFRVQAIDGNGTKRTHFIDTTSEDAAQRHVERMGEKVLSVSTALSESEAQIQAKNHGTEIVTNIQLPPTSPRPAPLPAPAPVCRMCNDGVIVRKTVYRMGDFVVALGYTMLALAPLGLIWAMMVLMQPQEPVEGWRIITNMARAAAQAGAVIVGFVSLVGAGIGWLLLRKKSVLKCNRCGVEVPASLHAMYDV